MAEPSGFDWFRSKFTSAFTSIASSILPPKKPEIRFQQRPYRYLTTFKAQPFAPTAPSVTRSDISYSLAKYGSDNTYRALDEHLPTKSTIKTYESFEKGYEELFRKKDVTFEIEAEARLNERVRQRREQKYLEEQQRFQADRQVRAEQVRRPVQKLYTSSIEAFHDASELHRDRDLIDRQEFLKKRQLPKLTSDHVNLIEKACRYQPVDEILVELQGVRITRKDIHTLMGLNWLNDEVINFYMSLIVERARCSTKLPKVYSFNTFFYTKLRSSGHSSLKRWTRKVDIFSYDLLIVPVHVGQNHWCLALIDLKNKKVSYCDSLGGSPQGCHATLADYLRDESLDKKKKEFCLDGWEFYTAYDHIPQQKNGSDCGVFTCTYAEYLSREAQLDFEQKDMPYFRKKMIVEIMLKRLLSLS